MLLLFFFFFFLLLFFKGGYLFQIQKRQWKSTLVTTKIEETKKENKQYKQNTQSFSDSLAYIMVNVNFISDTAKWLCDPKAPVCLNKQIKT